MGELVNLLEARRSKACHRAFGRWEKRLGLTPAYQTRLCDLPDPVLSRLAELNHGATLALYDVVLGVRGWGPGEGFAYLAAHDKLEALDSFLFLADQVRFELMRRLGWIEGLPAEVFPILDLASRSREIQNTFHPQVPVLRPKYHRYQEVEPRLAYEPAAVVRSLIPEALLVFRQKLAQGGELPPQDEQV